MQLPLAPPPSRISRVGHFLLDFVLVLRGLTGHFQMTLTMHGPFSPTLSVIL